MSNSGGSIASNRICSPQLGIFKSNSISNHPEIQYLTYLDTDEDVNVSIFKAANSTHDHQQDRTHG